MIGIKEQQKLLLDIARNLEQEITIYAIGGTAMMFLGMKEATLDIDLVFENEKDRKIFKKAAEKFGFKTMDSFVVYGHKENHPQMMKMGEVRLDLFVEEVIDFIFSKNMKARAEDMHEFGNNLKLKIANPHDIILMKCATERIKDLDDAKRILENKEINWKLILDECEFQVKLGKDRAIFDLGSFLEKLKEVKVNVPKEIIDKLYKMLKKQIKEKENL